MKRIGQALSILVVSLVVISAALPAYAYIYAGQRKRINCGIVLLNNGEDQSPNTVDCNGLPYRTIQTSLGSSMVARDYAYSLFTILQMRVDLKPLGWSFENPHAPGGLFTGATTRPEDSPENRPEYWFVNLHTYKDLTDMQVLYLPAAGSVNLRDEDREKLRQFVDAGGVLWIDNIGTGSHVLDFGNSFFITNFSFKRSNGGSDVAVSRHHPLLTLPFWISEAEIGALGANPGRSYCIPGYDVGGTGGWGGVSKAPLSFDILYSVTLNTSVGKPSIAANAYGSGRVVATSNAIGSGCLLNYPINMPSLKFAYNVIAWSASWTHLRKDPRHSGFSIDTVGGTKLVRSWSFLAPPATKIESAPVIYKNIVFYSSGSQLYALDLVPDEDLDQDGNPDDGLQGLGGGADTGQDIVWAWPGDGGMLSAPTLVTAQDPSNPGGSIEAVLVMSSTGKVYLLPAFPNNNGILIQTPGPILTWETNAGQISEPYPPLYVNGWIYAVGGDGRLHAYNPSLEAYGGVIGHPTVYPKWAVPNDPVASCTPKAGPAFAWVSNESNGALIGMVYWSGTTWPNGPPISNDWVYGAPVCVSNDRLKPQRTNSAGTLLECRIALPRSAVAQSPEPIVRVTRSDGSGTEIDVVNVSVNRKLQPNNKEAILEADAMGWMVIQTATAVPSDARIVAEYAVDYATGHASSSMQQAPIQRWLEPVSSPGVAGAPPPTRMIGTPALGPDNMIYACGTRASSTGGDSVYGMKNDGTSHSCKWNFHIHGGIPAASIGVGSPVGVPPVVFSEVTDVGGATQIVGLQEPKLFGSPAVARNKVFAAVSSGVVSSDPAAPSAALLCFKANPEFTIRITEPSGLGVGGRTERRAKRLYDATGRELSIRLWQPDLMSSGGPAIPPPAGATAITRNLGMIDHEKGTITFTTFDRPKLKGAMGASEVNTFVPSLPVWVYVENMEVPIDFNTWAPAAREARINGTTIPQPIGDAVDLSQWNNLLWYYVVPPHDDVPCSGIHSSPVVIGNTVYFVCDDGFLFAVPTDVEENTGGQVKAGRMIWSESVSDAMADMNTSIAGSNGVLLVPGSDGLHAYMNATSLVADSGRVMEVDGAGEASWSIDTITWPASIPQTLGSYPARMSGSINKPAKAKYAGAGDVLVVNTGVNQVCKIDKSGTVGIERIPNANSSAPPQYIRWIWDKFSDPKSLLRPGQPTELRGPTDAVFWREWDNGRLVVHCLIADSGNHRIVDLVYRMAYDGSQQPAGLETSQSPDPLTGFYLPELNWVSTTDSTNEQYVYESLQVVPNPTQSDGQYIWAAVSNYRTGTSWDAPGVSSGRGLGGAIVALQYRVPVSGGWNYGGDSSGQIVAACDKALWGGTPRPLAEPKYFQVMDRVAKPGSMSGGRYIIVCDNYGVYEVGPLPGGTAIPPVVRALEDDTYRNMPRTVIRECDNSVSTIPSLGVPLQARCVQELRNGNWLITNNYAGADLAGMKRFRGEVFELSWAWNSWTTIDQISWNSPSLYCECDITQPDKPTIPASWRQGAETTYVFQQPSSALRQF